MQNVTLQGVIITKDKTKVIFIKIGQIFEVLIVTIKPINNTPNKTILDIDRLSDSLTQRVVSALPYYRVVVVVVMTQPCSAQNSFSTKTG